MPLPSQPARDPLPAGLSIIVPVYGSGEMLPELARRLKSALGSQSILFELLLVDDGSPGESWRVIAALAQSNPWIRGIALMRNCGQHNAVLCGIRQATYDRILTMDDDLQHPPEEIARLLAHLTDQDDVVYGVPAAERHSPLRNVASRATKLMLKHLMGVRRAGDVSAFRLLRTELRDAFNGYQGSFVSIDVLLSWATTRFTAVAVRHDVRRAGSSNYTTLSLIRHAFNMITGFSTVPLRVASLVGFIFTLFGTVILLYVVVRVWIHGSSVPGFPFLASIIAIFSGAQLFAVGIIGEYLARIYFSTLKKPLYTIRKTTDGS